SPQRSAGEPSSSACLLNKVDHRVDPEEEAAADDGIDRLLDPLAAAHHHRDGRDADADAEDHVGKRSREEVEDRLAEANQRAAARAGERDVGDCRGDCQGEYEVCWRHLLHVSPLLNREYMTYSQHSHVKRFLHTTVSPVFQLTNGDRSRSPADESSA